MRTKSRPHPRRPDRPRRSSEHATSCRPIRRLALAGARGSTGAGRAGTSRLGRSAASSPARLRAGGPPGWRRFSASPVPHSPMLAAWPHPGEVTEQSARRYKLTKGQSPTSWAAAREAGPAQQGYGGVSCLWRTAGLSRLRFRMLIAGAMLGRVRIDKRVLRSRAAAAAMLAADIASLPAEWLLMPGGVPWGDRFRQPVLPSGVGRVNRSGGCSIPRSGRPQTPASPCPTICRASRS